MPRPFSLPRPKKTFSLARGIRVGVWIFAPILLLLGAVVLVQNSIDTKRLREVIIHTVKERTGQDVQIKGEVKVSLLPKPVIYVANIEVTNASNKLTDPELSVDMAILHIAPFSVLDEKPKLIGISLKHPVLSVQRASDKAIHWGWLNAGLFKDLTVHDTDNVDFSVKVAQGKILYTTAQTDDVASVDDVYFQGRGGLQPQISGEFTFFNRTVEFTIDSKAGEKPVEAGAQPFNVKLFSDDANVASLTGSINWSAPLPKIDGAFVVESDNLANWFTDKTQAPADAPVAAAPLPVKLTAQWTQKEQTIELKDVQWQGLNSAGGGTITMAWSNEVPDVQIDMNMRALDYNKWSGLFANVFALPPADKDAASQQPETMENKLKNPLPENLHMLAYLDVNNLIWGTQTLQHAKIQSTLSDGAVTVNQFNVEMPGETMLSFFGVISPASTGGLRFEGSSEIQGKSLRKMLTLFDDAANNLPEAGFGEFSARANLFISADQMRLSEAAIKLNDLQLAGGLVEYFDTVPRIEADVHLQDINFDYFRNVWRQENPNPPAGDYFLKFDKSFNFSWLKKLHASVDFKVAVDGFTMFEREGTQAEFRLFAREGELGLYNIRLTYPEDEINANVTINARTEPPAMNLVLNTNELNTQYFRAVSDVPPTDVKALFAENKPQKREWQDTLVDLSWLDGLSGSFDLTIGKLIHNDLVIDNLKTQGKIENSSMTFKNTSFNYWDGKVNLSGLLYGGKVPGITLSYALYNVQARDLLTALIYHDNISGRLSVTGSLNTSGVNYTSWLSQADASLVLSGRGINVGGFNLPGVINAVKISRTAADVFNNANLALTKGSTEFMVDGSINIKNAVAKTPGITLKSGVANGQLGGEIKLLPWKIDSTMNFTFQAFAGENPPTMTVQLGGPLESPELRSDTSSLEAYISKQIIGH